LQHPRLHAAALTGRLVGLLCRIAVCDIHIRQTENFNETGSLYSRALLPSFSLRARAFHFSLGRGSSGGRRWSDFTRSTYRRIVVIFLADDLRAKRYNACYYESLN